MLGSINRIAVICREKKKKPSRYEKASFSRVNRELVSPYSKSSARRWGTPARIIVTTARVVIRSNVSPTAVLVRPLRSVLVVVRAVGRMSTYPIVVVDGVIVAIEANNDTLCVNRCPTGEVAADVGIGMTNVEATGSCCCW